MLTGRGMKSKIPECEATTPGIGVIRVGEGTIRVGELTNKDGQNF